MGGLLGGGGGNSVQQEVYAGIQVSTSLYSGCIPYVAGRQRVPMNLLWYGGFQVHTSNSGGGKAGGGGNGTKQYSYSTAYIAGLTIGPIQGVTNIWHDKALVNLTFEGLALSEGGASFVASISGTSMVVTKLNGGVIAVGGAALTGPGVTAGSTITSGPGGVGTYVISPSQTVGAATLHSSQPTWSGYPAGTPTVQKIPYDSVAYVASSSYNLGSSASMPNLSFEVEGCVPGYSDANSIFDADPSAVFLDYLLDSVHGALANYPGTPLTLGSSTSPLQGTTNSYQSYVMSVGLLTSPYEDTQRQATDFVSELLQTTNSTCRLSVGTLEILPYADAAVSATVAGTAFSYTPNLTPIYSFTDDDYVSEKNEPPLKLTRVPQSDTYNTVSVEYNDRSNYYNQAPVTCTDLNDVALYGPRVGSQLSWHQITQSTVALLAGQFWLTRQLYERNSWLSRVRADYALLEPGDYIAHNDANLGLAGQVCQITQIEDDADNVLTLTSLELPGVTRSLAQFNWSAAAGYFANYETDPGVVQTPAIFVMPPIPASLSEGITIGIAVCGQTSNAAWLGCDAYCSVDGGTTYQYVGTIPEAARYGALTANLGAVADPDTTSTLSIALTNTNLQLSTSVTHADADSAQTMILIDTGTQAEVMSFGTAALASAGHYNLSYLRRGLYGSTDQAHTTGDLFVRIDGAIFQIAMDPGYAGQTISFKFVSFNTWLHYGPQTLAGSTAYSYTIPSALPVSGNLLLIPRGTCAVNGNNVYKQPNGTAAWDSDAYSPQGYLNGCFVSWTVSQNNYPLMVGLSANPVATVNYPSLNFGVYIAAGGVVGLLGIYELGVTQGSFGSFAVGDTFEIRYDGVTARYFHNGGLIRAVRAPGLTLYPKICINQPGGMVSNVQYGPASAVNQPSGSWLNTYPWVIGSSGSQGNYTDVQASGTASHIILGNGTGPSPYGPYGIPEPLWTGPGGSAINQIDAGWSDSGDLYGIDSTKTYRTVVWFRYHGGPGTAQFYFGSDTSGNTCNVGTQTGNSNPYFVSGTQLSGYTPDKWYLAVGFLHGSGYTGGNCGLAGIYDPVTGNVVLAGNDFNILAGAPFQLQRVFGLNTTVPPTMAYFFAKPRFEEVNGNEPSITTLLSPAGVLAYADNLDEVPDGSTYARTLAAYISSGVPYTYRGAYSGSTAYKVGDETTSGGNYYICTVANTGSTPPSADWTLLGPVTLDDLANGSTYARPLSGYLVNGVPYTNRGAYSGSTAYNVGDEVTLAGNTYLCVTASTGNSPPDATHWQVVGSPTAFVATNHCVISDTTAQRDGTAAAWDSCVYSLNGYTTCHIGAKVNSLSDAVMIGLSTAPTTSSVYTNMNYGWYNNGGTWTIFESGTNFAGANTTGALSDVAAVTYDGSTITYLLNGVSKRTVSVSSLFLYGFCPFNSALAAINSLSFGPTTNFAVQDTSQIGANAVSQIVSATRASASSYSFHTTLVDVDDLTASITTTGNPVGIDVTFELEVATNGGIASIASPMTATVTRAGSAIGTSVINIYDYVVNTQPVGSPASGWTVQQTLTVMDTPAAGTYTYALHLHAAASGGAGSVHNLGTVNPTLKIREYKK